MLQNGTHNEPVFAVGINWFQLCLQVLEKHKTYRSEESANESLSGQMKYKRQQELQKGQLMSPHLTI